MKIEEMINEIKKFKSEGISTSDLLLGTQIGVLVEIVDELKKLNKILSDNADSDTDDDEDVVIMTDLNKTPENSEPAKDTKATNSLRLKKEQDGSLENYM